MVRDTQYRLEALATQHDQSPDSPWPGREAIQHVVLLGAETIFIFVIVFSLGVLSDRWNRHYDLTSHKKSSLTPMTHHSTPPDGPGQNRVSTPRQALYLSVFYTRLFFWLMVVLEPALVCGIGLIVYIRRRKQG